MNDKAKNFLKYLYIAVQQGFDPLVVYTHACHESGDFTRVIGLSNVWGIKASPKWTGLIAELWTHEDEPCLQDEQPNMAQARLQRKYGDSRLRIDQQISVKGQKYWHCSVPQKFRDWAGFSEAIPWYCDLIKRMYTASYENRNSSQFFFGLVGGENKYATDPAYVGKLISLYDTLSKDAELMTMLYPEKPISLEHTITGDLA